ncbi:MAG: putative Mg2+ transporter-C (MgtC) family protein [Patescibacteria group bacterium]|nr:putative Mg2+ transporter-C (MgtC) family protein [Patescibacteria group bacterium]
MVIMQNIFDPATLEIICRLAVALLLGMLIGVERVWAHKTAGIRTYALVSMGSALFVIISEMMAQAYGLGSSFDPSRIASQVVVGVGFIGAGLIFTKDSKLVGITTATGLWVSAGIGMASGFGLYKVSIIATVLTLFVFVALWFFEAKLKKTELYKEQHLDDNQ